MDKCKFEINDIIRLKRGKMPMKINRITNRYNGFGLECEYLHNGSTKRTIDTEVVIYEEEDNMSKIAEYTFHGLFAEHGTCKAKLIGNNTKNQLVLELIPDGIVITVDKEDVTEVLPFTFSVKTMNSSYNKGMSYIGRPGVVKVGDLLLTDECAFVKVTDIDTKDRNVKRKFSGYRLDLERF